MLKKVMQFQTIILVLAIIAIGGIWGDDIPLTVKVYSFTFSNLMRQVLMFLLPLLIFPYMATSIAAMKTRGAYLVLGIIVMVALSNFISIMIPYFVGSEFIPLLNISQGASVKTMEELNPLFEFPFKPFLSMEWTMLIALFVGLVIGFTNTHRLDGTLDRYMALSKAFFEKVFIPTLPLYVWGTILKISYETDLATMMPQFGKMIVMIVIVQLIYISFLYYVGSGFKIGKTFDSLKNAFPSAVVGFSTMSSVVTMPVTLRAAEQNIPEDPQTARVAISTTVNCHDVGECISLPMIALTIFYMHFGFMPSFETYVIFAFFTTIAQFGGVSVPGGSIVLILPFLSKYLDFTGEMTNLIIALSIFMDPIGTANNVLGNGAFATIINKVNRIAGRLKGLCAKA